MFATELDDVCAEIRAAHRQRQFALDTVKRNTQSLRGFLRLMLGWHRGLPAPERKLIAERAKAAVKAGERAAKDKPTDDPVYREWQAVIDSSLAARLPFERIEKESRRQLEELAERLPVWAWAGKVRGFGAVSLGAIVGEAGNIDRYDRESKLWKRLGVAVLDGIRQGGLPKTAKKSEWVRHGYSAQRRSFLFVVGDNFVKQRGSLYREIYDRYKVAELDKAAQRGQTVEPAGARTTKDPLHFMAAAHVHKRAKRRMEKKFLRDLWRAWHRASSSTTVPLPPSGAVPRASATSTAAAAVGAVPRGRPATAAAAGPSSEAFDLVPNRASQLLPHPSPTSEIVPARAFPPTSAADPLLPRGLPSFVAVPAYEHVPARASPRTPAIELRVPSGQSGSVAGPPPALRAVSARTTAALPAATKLAVSQDQNGGVAAMPANPVVPARAPKKLPATQQHVPQGQTIIVAEPALLGVPARAISLLPALRKVPDDRAPMELPATVRLPDDRALPVVPALLHVPGRALRVLPAAGATIRVLPIGQSSSVAPIAGQGGPAAQRPEQRAPARRGGGRSKPCHHGPPESAAAASMPW